MSPLLDIDEFEVQASAFIWKLGQVLPEKSTLASVQLLIPVSFNDEYFLFPELAIHQVAFALLHN